jgi:hypothetical protein
MALFDNRGPAADGIYKKDKGSQMLAKIFDPPQYIHVGSLDLQE